MKPKPAIATEQDAGRQDGKMMEVGSSPRRRASHTTSLRLGCGLLVAVLCVTMTVLSRQARTGLIHIDTEQRGILESPESRGYNCFYSKALAPGYHLLIPYLQRAHVYSLSPVTYAVEGAQQGAPADALTGVQVRTKDGRSLLVKAAITYSVDPNRLVELHCTWQWRYQDELVPFLARKAISDAASSSNSYDILGAEPLQFEQAIAGRLEPQMLENYLILIDVAVFDADLTAQ